MNSVIIFGTGKSAEKVLSSLNKDKTIIEVFVDNNYSKQGTFFNNKLIIAPNDISKHEYDYIIIAIIKYHDVVKQLVSLGIEQEKCLSYFDIDIVYRPYINEIFMPNIILKDNYDLKINTLMGIVENMPYEICEQIRNDNLELPHIKGIDETINEILEKKVSISRYGDGELMLIVGEDLRFQNANPKLAKRLKEILKSNISNHIIGLFDVYGDLSKYNEDFQDFLRKFFYTYKRKFQYSLIDMKKDYYNAFISRPYIIFQNKSKATEHFNMIKKIWENRDIVIIEGDRTRLGVGNDLFDNTTSCQRIICPNENAFDVYEKIIDEARGISKTKLILLALGPTATVLAYDLAREGYQAIDIGHIDVEYEWYLLGVSEKVALKNKYTNEVFGGNSELEYQDEYYKNQIIAEVKQV